MAPEKPDFSGTWKFNRARSSLQTAAPDSTVFVVNHREPFFRFSRTHAVGGKLDTFSLELTTDGREVCVDRGGLRLRCRAHWDSGTLVFDTRLTRGGEEAENLVRYTLLPGGDGLRADERFRSPSVNYDNVWLLDRVAPRRRAGEGASETASAGETGREDPS